jgi:hypothetical protein
MACVQECWQAARGEARPRAGRVAEECGVACCPQMATQERRCPMKPGACERVHHQHRLQETPREAVEKFHASIVN